MGTASGYRQPILFEGNSTMLTATRSLGRPVRWILGAAIIALAGLSAPAYADDQAPPPLLQSQYIIGPGDTLNIFVWRNPDLSTKVPVRPDGRISIPLIDDIDCTGKTPTQLAADIQERLRKYITDPRVTVMVSSFFGAYEQQVRVVGEAVTPKAVPYNAHMTILDAMIEVGGLTQYAAGNRTTIVRVVDGKQKIIHVDLADLLKDGDVEDNIELRPGDIIIIPQSFF
jgi:polysaccharide export outer membrane protein